MKTKRLNYLNKAPKFEIGEIVYDDFSYHLGIIYLIEPKSTFGNYYKVYDFVTSQVDRRHENGLSKFDTIYLRGLAKNEKS